MSKREVQLAISLFEAIDDRNLSNIIILLEKYNANPNIIIPKLGISPLHFAAGYEDLSFSESVMELLLKKSTDANIFTLCESKLTPLHIAALWNRPKIVRMLLEKGAELDLKCNEEKTAIEYAIEVGNFDVIQEIKKFVFEKKIEKKKNDLIQSQKSGTPKVISDVENSPKTPAKTTITKALQSIDKKKFTPNRINYNFDITSPYYINITHRRHKNSNKSLEVEENEENERKAEQEIRESAEVEVCNEKKNLFELTRKNLKEFSKQVDKAIVINRIAIHKRKSYILEWREKIHQMREENEKLDFSYADEILNSSKSSNEASSVIEVKSSSAESFITAQSDLMRSENVLCNNAFIEQEDDQEVELIESLLEHTDIENGIILYEKKIHKRRTDIETSMSTVNSLPPLPLDYDTDTLKEELKSFGRNPGPITKSTKRIYLKQLMKFKRKPELVQENNQFRVSYPDELYGSITNYDNFLKEKLQDFLALETKMINYFLENAHLRWREGNSKTSFVYLLLDPRITENLPLYHAKMKKKSEVWEKFLNSIFYVGKGKRARPYQHLYEAIKINSASNYHKKITESTKISRINDIWKENHGVVCLHIFHNIMACEAFSREAALIEAIGIRNLTNSKCGEYYGATKCFTMKQKRQLGMALLHRALHIYLAEGESQLKPSDF